MLHLSISVFLSILFCLDIVNSFTNSGVLLKKYQERLKFVSKKKGDQEEIYAKYVPVIMYDICKKPREVRATICAFIIRRLRSSSKVYNNLYMNYLAFTVREPCKEIKVWINQGEILVRQQALNCFGRSAFMSVELSEEIARFYHEIVIYPWNAEYLLVFQYNKDKNYYILLEEYKYYWKNERAMSHLLFFTPIPQVWREVSNLFRILHPMHSKLTKYSKNMNNIVNYSNTETLFKICNEAFRSENHNKQLHFKGLKNNKPSPEELQATLRGPVNVFDLQVSILAYPCKNSVVVVYRSFMSKYYIAAGPADHSVILLEEMSNNNNDSSHYAIIGFVEYVTDDYILLYYRRSY